MRVPSRLLLAAALVFPMLSAPLFAEDDSTDRLDDAWVERALANPSRDKGWCQSCNADWKDGRVSHCDVRRFSYARGSKNFAINGGQNSGMTVMGWDRDSVRILYRVTARAHTEERARALAAEIGLELSEGWLRPAGPAENRTEWWSVEIKAWVPSATNVAAETHNGPLGLRGVRGTMDLKSMNGPVSLVDVAGAVQARVENGPLYVALSGSHWDGTGLDAAAENGPVTLDLPADYSAHLVTGTINGPQDIDYAVQSSRGQSWIDTKLGKGGPLVRVVTTNGPYHMGHR